MCTLSGRSPSITSIRTTIQWLTRLDKITRKFVLGKPRRLETHSIRDDDDYDLKTDRQRPSPTTAVLYLPRTHSEILYNTLYRGNGREISAASRGARVSDLLIDVAAAAAHVHRATKCRRHRSLNDSPDVPVPSPPRFFHITIVFLSSGSHRTPRTVTCRRAGLTGPVVFA